MGRKREAPSKLPNQDIAIVGMACRFPGANHYTQFWNNLINAINSIQEITPDRWDINEYYSPDPEAPNKSNSKWGGLLDQIDQFDNQFFNISPREAQAMDPQQRLLLEETWHCIEDSGIDLSELQKAMTSVFVGVMAIDYQHLFDAKHITDSYDCIGNFEGILANRLSYYFNFTGDSRIVDAACASSLVSIHDACKSLNSGESDYAIAAGVSVICHPWKYISFSKSHMLSPEGRCKTFDAEANGYVPGEGVGALLLEPLEKAVEHGHHIYGVIKGSAVHHSGRTKTITAPKVEAQCKVIEEAQKQGNISSETITYLEAHGTGTSLGDPIEIEALTQSFNTDKKQYCYIGSVKSNFGHLEAAAGIAGVIKVLLMMQNKKIPKTLNIKTVNPIIDFEHSPFRVADRLYDWKLPENISIRRAGVSSFGFGGVNSHVVLEEYVAPTEKIPVQLNEALPFVLSAKSAQSLKALLNEWQAYSQTEVFQAQSLTDICYTLTTGREAFPYRFGKIIKNKEDLLREVKQNSTEFHDAQANLKKKSIVLLLKPNSTLDVATFDKICQQHPILNQIKKELALLANQVKNENVNDFIHLYVLSSALLASGLEPNYVIGEGIGEVVAAVITGMLDVKAAIQWLSGAKQDIPLQHPKMSFYNRELKEFIQPYEITPNYCQNLIQGLELDDSVNKNLLLKSSDLYSNQLTFKKLLTEWSKVFQQYNITIEKALHDIESLLKQQKLLFLLASLHAWKSLNQKWDLSEKIVIPNINAAEIVDLLLDEVLTKELVAEFILNSNETTWKKAVAYIEGHEYRLDRKKPYTFLKQFNRPIKTIIPDAKVWLDKMLEKQPVKEDAVNAIKHSLYIDISEAMSNLPIFLLRVWLEGISLEWQNWFFVKAEKRVSLPGYPFAREHYWVTEPISDNKPTHIPAHQKKQGLKLKQVAAASVQSSKADERLTTFTSNNYEPKRDIRRVARPDVMTSLKEFLATILYTTVDQIPFDKTFQEIGMDSILGVEFVKKINEAYQLNLSATKIYDYPGIEELSAYIGEQLGEVEKTPQATVTAPERPLEIKKPQKVTVRKTQPATSTDKSDIAIIGMAGQFPGAKNIQEFWRNLTQGKSSVTEIPKERWSINEYYDADASKPNKSYCKHGGFLDDIDLFDPLFFKISGADAEWMDPQQRLLLETAWTALEDAGYSSKDLSNTSCGFYVGVMNNDYQELIDRTCQSNQNAQQLIGNSNSILPARISYFLNLKGPAVALDTACSSSLVAIHLACKALQDGESELMLAGGVTLYLTESSYITMCKAGMLSPEGKCKTFDNSADGFVPGEGVGIILLKRLDKALEDGDHIYGVIKASGINQDGKTNGITAPSANSQKELELNVYKQYAINPESISYIEAHGTGTKLGDPIEIEALTEAFRKYTGKKQYCAIGAVKTNIGHTSAAAGVSSVIKTVLCLQNKKLVPSLNFHQENEHIHFKDSPFYVNTEYKDWHSDDGAKRQSGVSSFGFSGTNAHIVIEEAPESEIHHDNAKSNYLITLSATTDEALKQKIQDLAAWVKKQSIENTNGFTSPQFATSLQKISYALNVGRTHFDKRCAIVASSIEELAEILSQVIKGQKPSNYLLSKQKYDHEPIFDELLEKIQDEILQYATLDPIIYKRKLLSLGDLYIKGYDLGWERLHQDESKQKISLPTYPFAKEHYWALKKLEPINAPLSSPFIDLYPLINANVSTITGLSYSKLFTGKEYYLTDHHVNDVPILPSVIYFEMARMAGSNAVPNQKVIGLRNILLGKPITIKDEPKKVAINLYPKSSGIDFEILTQEELNDPFATKELAKVNVHAQGKIIFGLENAKPKILPIDIQAIKRRCKLKKSGKDLYAERDSHGFYCGPSFQTIDEISSNEKELIAHIRLPKHLHDDAHQFVLHPSIMDGALETIFELLVGEAAKTTVHLPLSISEVNMIKPFATSGYVYATFSQNSKPGILPKFNVQITDENGNVLIDIKDYGLRVLPLSELKTKEVFYYKPTWVERIVGKTKTIDFNGPVLLFDNEGKITSELREKYPEQTFIHLTMGESYQVRGIHDYEINNNNAEEYKQLFNDLNNKKLLPNTIIYLTHLHTAQTFTEIEIQQSLQESLYGLFYLTQSLILQKPKNNIKILCVNVSDEPSLFAKALSGYAKTLHIEQPKIDCRVIQITKSQGRKLEWLLNELIHPEPEVIYDGKGIRYVKSYSETTVAKDPNSISLKKNGVYLISGGAGGLGLIFARYLAKQYQAKLILVGRSSLNQKQLETIASLEQLGAEVLYVQADVAKYQDVEELIQKAKNRFGTLHGVIHCAGVIHDSFIFKKTLEEVKNVLAPKIYGTIYLDVLTKSEPLDLFVMFSSIAAVFGNTGQCDYAYANSFLNNFSDYRENERKQGRRRGNTISIVWPLWASEEGMQIDESYKVLLKKTLGMDPLTVKNGMQAFLDILTQENSQVIVLSGQKSKLEESLDKVSFGAEKKQVKPLTSQDQDQSVKASLQHKTEDYLKTILSEPLKFPRDKLAVDTPFEELGIDSIMIMNLNRVLEESFGDLPITLFFEYRTLQELASYFIEHQHEILIQKLQITLQQPEATETKVSTKLHALLDNGVISSSSSRFTKLVTGNEFYLKDHRVKDIPTLPGVVYLEMARAAGVVSHPEMQVLALRHIQWVTPIQVLDSISPITINLTYSDGTHDNFEVSTQLGSKYILHANGKIVYGTRSDSPCFLDINAIKKRCEQIKTGETIYSKFPEIGFDYGLSFRTIQNLWHNDQEVLAELQLPAQLEQESMNFELHPSLMDGALQIVFPLLKSNGEKTIPLYLPFSIGELDVFGKLPSICYSYATLVPDSQAKGAPAFQVQLTDGNGKVLVMIKDFTLRPAHTKANIPAEPIKSAEATHGFASSAHTEKIQDGLKSTKIAVIGMAGRFPGSPTIETFWENLNQGKELISEIPKERWALSEYYSANKSAPNKSYSKWGGFIENIDRFDAGFFNISRSDAIMMDPPQRLLLEVAQELLDRSGYQRSELSGRKVGVFIGGGTSDYHHFYQNNIINEWRNHHIVNYIQNMLAARISDFYNFTGPAYIIDTACSSSLVAIHQACQSILSGECELAVTGGSEILIGPAFHIDFSKADVLSDDGKSYVFDERAKGFVLGEGLGLVMLKKYEQALKDGDNIIGVILSSAINNDGHTPGITVPNPKAQQTVIQDALNKSGITPDSISYYEAHGTGTLLGDPIEIKGMTEVFRHYTDRKGYCAVGSVKSNIGHILRAAGIASFIKVLLSMQHKIIPPSLNCEHPHPRFNFPSTPFYPITKCIPWDDTQGIRRAAISSFGFGGTNCHLILEEVRNVNNTRKPLPITQFKRERYWLGDYYPGTSSVPQKKPELEFINYPSVLNEIYHYNERYLKDHQVFGQQILLGVTHCSLAINAFKKLNPDKQLTGLSKVYFEEAIVIDENQQAEVIVDVNENAGKYSFTNRYHILGDDAFKMSCTGEYFLQKLDARKAINLELLKNNAVRVLEGEAFYRNETDIFHGSSLHTLERAYIQENSALGELDLSQQMRIDSHQYKIHPALLDAAFVTGLLILEKIEGSYIPFMIKEIKIWDDLPNHCYCFAELKKSNAELLEFSMQLCDESGNVLVKIDGAVCKRIKTIIKSNDEKKKIETKFDTKEKMKIPSAETRSVYSKDESNDIQQELLSAIIKYFINKLSPMLPSNTVVDIKKNIMDMGIESINLIKLTKEIEGDAKIELYPTLFFEYSNIADLSHYFATEHNGAFSSLLNISQKTISEEVTSLKFKAAIKENSLPIKEDINQTITSPEISVEDNYPVSSENDIAVIGMSGMFAGSPDLNSFWENLKNKTDLITEIPLDHWDYRPWFDTNQQAENKTYCKWGSFISDVDKFDAKFFNISPLEAEVMDPQLRLLLQVLYSTAEDAGYAEKIRNTNTGMYVGACFHDYQQEFSEHNKAVAPHDGTGNASTMLANRPSFFFNLSGPSLSVDTACSSSLVALHLACQALKQKECDMAFVAGTNLLLGSWHYRYFCSIGALSPTGRCHTFDAAADGYVPGEGVAAVLLKPLKGAIRDGDHIYAIIKGSAINHGGYTPSITAPSIKQEANVILKAWNDAKIDPNTITYIEAHGTGTKLGDPVEIEGLKKAFSVYGSKGKSCAIGSAKAHIGHTEGTAGIAGIIKVILSMQHHEIVAMPEFNELNPFIKLTDSPLYINQEVEKWMTKDNIPRRAGVSSFGFGGAYAHVVVEEAPMIVSNKRNTKSNYLITLSAPTDGALKQKVIDLNTWLSNTIQSNTELDMSSSVYLLEDISYTLNACREHFKNRYGIVVQTLSELQQTLQHINQGQVPENTFSNLSHVNLSKSGEADKDVLKDWMHSIAPSNQLTENEYRDKLLDLANYYVEGYNLDWDVLHQGESKIKISLPTYPFAKKRYWYDSYNISEKKQKIESGTPKQLNQISESVKKVEEEVRPYHGNEVLLEIVNNNIAIIKMADKENRNMITKELINGLQAKFKEAQSNPQVKVIIITGYGNIFSMGGDKEGLIAISTGKIKYTDTPFVYRGLLDCSVPVIAAMQGHAFGAGLAFGLYADIVIMAEDHLYTANFMKYGFTPGMGSTLILKEKLSDALAMEMMWTAKEYTGAELKSRGASVIFKNGSQVLSEAMTIAKILAKKPRQTLTTFKKQMSHALLSKLPKTIEQELQMHHEVFASGEVTGNIINHFDKIEAFHDEGKETTGEKETMSTIPKHTQDKIILSSKESLKVSNEKETMPTDDMNFIAQPDYDKKDIFNKLLEIVSDNLHMPPEEKIDLQLSFNELGVDSIGAVEIIRAINQEFHLALEVAAIYDDPTIKQLSNYISDELNRNNEQIVSQPVEPKVRYQKINSTSITLKPTTKNSAQVSQESELPKIAYQKVASEKKSININSQLSGLQTTDIAIIGFSGRFPGARNPEEFWQNLATGKSSISEIPPERWPIEGFYDTDAGKRDKSYSKWGGFLDGVDQFDPLFFEISPAEAEFMDPQQRLFLEECWNAIEDAGYANNSLSGKKCGVFVGGGAGDYTQKIKMLGGDSNAQLLMGSSISILSARIAYILDLKGPSVAIDTACSSSLVAIHLACQSLYSGESEMALAGGVYITTMPDMYFMTCKAGMLSPEGKCKTFDNSADGFVIGEGVGVVLLKPLAKALEDKDTIHAVIKGSSINQDGKTNGITAPSAKSQTALELDVYQRFHIDPQTISYVEAHGTGTKLGDPIEVSALTRAFRAYTDKKQFCGIGSVKTNIGHPLSAAGIAGIIKILLCLTYKKLVPTLNITHVNEHINFKDSPFYVNTELKDWKTSHGIPRRAAINSFGFSGTNAHLIIEEAPDVELGRVANKPVYLLTLSAKTDESLKQRIADLAAWLNLHEDITLEEVSYTLNVGRSHFAERCALVVTSFTELKETLTQIKENTSLANVFMSAKGKEKPHDQAIFKEVFKQLMQEIINFSKLSPNDYRDKLLALANFYAEGYNLDWERLHQGESKRKISLPTYPFAQERYWITEEVTGSLVEAQRQPGLHLEAKKSLPVDEAYLLEKVRSHIILRTSELLKLDIKIISINKGLSEYGVDSISLTKLSNQLNSDYGLKLTPANLFEHTTLKSLAHYLVANHQAAMAARHGEKGAPVAHPQPEKAITLESHAHQRYLPSTQPVKKTLIEHEEEIAIIGMSGVFPGSPNLDAFWRNLVEQKDLITEIPKERWDWQAYYGEGENKTKSKWGGFIEGIDLFDAGFFNISPREAELMDPQQRLFLEAVWEAMEDSGMTKEALSAIKTGLFVGVASIDYDELMLKANETSAYVSTGQAHSVLANRISYCLDLHGPSEAIDTACSSSLVAIHHAVKAIQDGDCEMAIAGGVNALLTPTLFIEFSQAGMLSEDGRCKTFDKSANGYVRGEGVGAILLKPLSKALADSDTIYGVIKGSATNHGGHVSSLTVPNPNAQAEVISQAIERANIPIDTVSYVETHGTGTSLGDPIEVNGLKKAFNALQEKQGKTHDLINYCGLGTVKTNIGHLETAAGIAGVIKVLLAMRHGKIPGNVHFHELNPYIEIKDSPFYIAEKTNEWNRLKDKEGNEIPRRAGVSSFGFGGANAHIVIEEAPALPSQPLTPQKPAYLITLSAKSDDSLQQKVIELTAWVKDHPEVSIEEVSYNLNAGRSHFDKRCALVASSMQELLDVLKQVDEGKHPDNYLLNTKEKIEHQPIFDELLERILEEITKGLDIKQYRKKLLALGDLYVKGYDLDWGQLYQDESRRKISLPTYPFAKKRYWYDSYNVSEKIQKIESGTPKQLNQISESVKKVEEEVSPYHGNEVLLEIVNNNIAIVKMMDKENHNMITKELINGLQAKFKEAQSNPQVKVIIITGYGNIFSMGGDKDGLIAIAENKAKCTDATFIYRGLLECELPVIAAMQGHAHGGGFVFGLYADIIIISEENTYSANFMRYGFTPGVGATYIMEKKLGNIAMEMMYTAKLFTGAEIKERSGGSVIVRKQDEVLNEAIAIAMNFTEKPTQSLKVFKKEMSKRVLDQLPAVLEGELKMHEQTFSSTEVKEKIEKVFDTRLAKKGDEPLKELQDKVRLKSPDVNKPISSATPPTQELDMQSIGNKLIKIVIDVLHHSESEIKPDVNLNELGADSIAIVEIVRQINQEYGLTIESTDIYAHSTIGSLVNFISEKLYQVTKIRRVAVEMSEADVIKNTVVVAKPMRTQEVNPINQDIPTQNASISTNDNVIKKVSKKELPAANKKIKLVLLKSKEDKILRSSIIENYQKTFINYDQLNISLIKSSHGIDIEVIQAGTGEPVLLLPPGGCLTTTWRYQLAELSKHYKIITISYPGCGQSGFKDEFHKIDKLSELIIEIINKMDIYQPLNIVGWSLGGMIGQYIASHYSERVKTLTLVNSAALYKGDGNEKDLVEDFQLSKKENKNIDISGTEIYGVSSNEFWSGSWSGSGMKVKFDATEMLKQIHIPVLIIAGNRDKIMPVKISLPLWLNIKSAELHRLKAGHFIPLFNSGYFNKKLINFIKKYK